MAIRRPFCWNDADVLGRWVVWLGLVAVWTVGLLTPNPDRAVRDVLPPQALFPAAKALHVSAYAFLAALAAWLPLRGPLRGLPVAFLALHGAATEFLQQFVPTRTASVRDVLLDLAGIGLGLILSWPWWRPRRDR
jgi:hypothetical protein